MPRGYVTPREVICGGCQKPFMATGTRSRFCSRKCTDKEQWDRKHRKEVRCKVCKAVVDRNYSREFCSRVCSDRAWRIKHFYNLSIDDFERMREEQNNACAICMVSTTDFHIDHDHACCPDRGGKAKTQTCGKCIRGLLCKNCNQGLGRFKDSVKFLQNAINYLTKVV